MCLFRGKGGTIYRRKECANSLGSPMWDYSHMGSSHGKVRRPLVGPMWPTRGAARFSFFPFISFPYWALKAHLAFNAFSIRNKLKKYIYLSLMTLINIKYILFNLSMTLKHFRIILNLLWPLRNHSGLLWNSSILSKTFPESPISAL